MGYNLNWDCCLILDVYKEPAKPKVVLFRVLKLSSFKVEITYIAFTSSLIQ